MDWLLSLGTHWAWFALGLLLAAAEMLVPGVFFIWMAGAAILTGILTFILPIGVVMQIAIFVVLAMVTVYTGKRYLRDHPITEADPLMNKRGGRLVGETAVVVSAIEGGSGRVRHGDSEWIARGPDSAVGARVRISGSEGAVLMVEPEEG